MYPRGPFLWGTGYWQDGMRATSSSLQWCLQKWHEVNGHRNQLVGIHYQRSPMLEHMIYTEDSSEEKRIKGDWWKVNNKATLWESAMFTCIHCNWDCHSYVSLCNHDRCCSTITRWRITLWVKVQGFSRLMNITHNSKTKEKHQT